ncbi:MAG: substrate-binding domain-containing protein [Oscillospiraceae bacterium]
MALITYNQLNKLGRRVPEDVQIIGFDGIMDSSMIGVELSTVRQNIEEMAKIAIDLVIKKINGEKTAVRTEGGSTFRIGDTTVKD